MAISNHERVGKALDLLKTGLGPFVDRELQAGVKAQLVNPGTLRKFVDDPLIGNRPATEWDVAALLKLMWETWNDVFRRILGRAERSLVNELRDHRNAWAHQKPFSSDDAYRALDSTSRLLTAVSAEEAGEVEKLKMELLRVRFDEQARGGAAQAGESRHRGDGWDSEAVARGRDAAPGRGQRPVSAGGVRRGSVAGTSR